MKTRGLQIVEINRVMFVATPAPLHPDVGEAAVILARRDGSESVVLIRRRAAWYCSCGNGNKDGCRHYRALVSLNLIRQEVVVRPAAQTAPVMPYKQPVVVQTEPTSTREKILALLGWQR